MKRYIVLLRAVNISGKNKLSMPEFKTALEQMGFLDVRTLLNSGNAALDAEEGRETELAAPISHMLKERFGLAVPVFVISRQKLALLLEKAPEWWGTEDKAVYDNLIFVMEGYTAGGLSDEIGEPSQGIERTEIVDNAVFWSFDLSRYAKANWWKKTSAPGIGEKITVRTAGTCRKLAKL